MLSIMMSLRQANNVEIIHDDQAAASACCKDQSCCSKASARKRVGRAAGDEVKHQRLSQPAPSAASVGETHVAV